MPDGVEDDVNLPPYIRLSFPTVVTPGGRALPSVTRERRMEDMRLHLPYSLNLISSSIILLLLVGSPKAGRSPSPDETEGDDVMRVKGCEDILVQPSFRDPFVSVGHDRGSSLSPYHSLSLRVADTPGPGPVPSGPGPGVGCAAYGE